MSVIGSAKTAKLGYHRSLTFSKKLNRSNEIECFVQELVKFF